VQAYANEAELQELIAQSPELVSDLDERPGVAVRELSVPDAGYLDVLIIHLDGSLTLVGAKLNRNPEIRRAVVGQLLGYAGGLWRLGYERLDGLVRQREGASLVELAKAVAADDDFDGDSFRQAVARNLSEGTFRLIFAVDEITEDLKRAVEYLNAHTVDGMEVVVLELGYAKVGDVEILLPRTFGEEAARAKRASRGQSKWTEAELMEALAADSAAEEVAAARRLYEWAVPRVHHFYWGEGQAPSCTMAFEVPEGMIQPCSIYTSGTGSHGVGVNFDWARRRPRASLEQLLEELAGLPTIARLRDEILAKDFAKRPTVPLSELTGERMDLLISAMQGLLEHPAAQP
jgi:hypothetical protein